MIEIIPNWHPIFVHYTVALLSIAALLKFASLFIRNESLRTQWQIVARWNLWFGAGFTVLTVLAGWLAYNSVAHDTASHAAMTDHRNWALITAPLFVAIAIWSMLRARAGKGSSIILVVALLVASGLLGATAWRGGEVVYRYGLGVMSLPKPDSDDHDHASNVSNHDADDHSENGTVMMKDADSSEHDETSEVEGDLHKHADGSVDRH